MRQPDQLEPGEITMQIRQLSRKYSGNASLNFLLALLISLSVILFMHSMTTQKAIRHTPGTLVQEEPTQTMLNTENQWKINDYIIKPVATFYIRARVLHTRQYSNDREADLSPIDLALGWGQLSDQAILDKITITQSNRWYYWRYENPPPIKQSEIIAQSSNMHMIPASSYVKDKLNQIREGNIVRISGYLVNISGSNNYKWNSSTSRTDTNQGSCEVVWVESVTIE